MIVYELMAKFYFSAKISLTKSLLFFQTCTISHRQKAQHRYIILPYFNGSSAPSGMPSISLCRIIPIPFISIGNN